MKGHKRKIVGPFVFSRELSRHLQRGKKQLVK
jgi:hypothetical protein